MMSWLVLCSDFFEVLSCFCIDRRLCVMYWVMVCLGVLFFALEAVGLRVHTRLVLVLAAVFFEIGRLQRG